MKNKDNLGCSYHKAFLHKVSDNTYHEIYGEIQLWNWVKYGEIICVIDTKEVNGDIYELWLTDKEDTDKGIMLGNFKKEKDGRGIFKLRLTDIHRLDSYPMVYVLARNRSRRKKTSRPVLCGNFPDWPRGCLTAEASASDSSASNYLWDTNVNDFPLLLGQMMQRADELTEKVSMLEKKRLSKRKMPVIKRVEPFRPPIGNYKWWQLGN